MQIEESKETLLLAAMATPIIEKETSLAQNDILDHVIQAESMDHVNELDVSTQEEADSDDDLIPYDITCVNSTPHYLREAMQGQYYLV